MMPPEVFSIRLLPATECDPDGQRLGEIRIDSFVERFAIYPFAGSAESLAAGWFHELRLLVAGVPAVGLPTACNMTWVLYRFGSMVFVQQMLMLEGVGPKLSSSGKVEQIPAHHEVGEDGQAISQWTTTIEAVSAFVAT